MAIQVLHQKGSWMTLVAITGLITMRRGMRLRIHGFFQSRDFKENLAEIVEKAQKRSGVEITLGMKDMKPEQIAKERNSVEVVARRPIMLDKNAECKERYGPVYA